MRLDIFSVVSTRACNASNIRLLRWFLKDGIELMFIGIGLVCVPSVMIAYSRINKQREAIMQANGGVSPLGPIETRELGDRAPDFRYTL